MSAPGETITAVPSNLVKTTLRVVLVAAYYGVSRTLLVVLAGTSVSVACLVLLRPELSQLAQAGGLPAARVAGANPVALLIFAGVAAIAYWKVTSLLLLFALLFPAAYWIAGQRYGIGIALLHLWQNHREPLLGRIAHGLHACMAHVRAASAPANQAGAQSMTTNIAARYVQRLDNVPRIIRVPVRQLLRKIGFEEMACQFYAAGRAGSITSESFTAYLLQQAGAVVEERILRPRLAPVLWLATANVAVMLLLKCWI